MTTPIETLAALNKNAKQVLKNIKVEDLVAALKLANEKYRNEDETLISDALYDMALEHLEKIAPNHPFLSAIGASVKGEKVKIPYWMGSLDKIKDDSKTIEKWRKTYPGQCVISDKLDGNSGLLVMNPSAGINTLYSRGDGEHGQDLSSILKYIKIPTVNETCAVRGELIISKKNWEKIKDKGANARNVVAGTLHTSDPDKEIASKIDFVVYELIYPKMKPSDGLAYMQEAGFKVVHHDIIINESDISLDRLSEMLMERRNQSPYEIDGIVVYQDTEHKVIKGKNPKYAFAFKSIHTQEEAEVTVSHIEWNISKHGLIKPIVHFPTVNIGGVKIQRATGFNAAFIEENKIGPGAQIVIIRSGDVIPHIVRINVPSSNGRAALPEDIEYEWTETHVDIVVKNEKGDNKEVQIKTLEGFANKLDIPYLGPGTIAKLYEAGTTTLPKLMHLTAADILKIEGFQKTSAEKLEKSLNTVRETALCADLMAATNIFGRGLGSRKITPVLKMYPDIITKRSIPTIGEVTKVEGIAEKTAKLFVDNLPKFFKLIDEMEIPCRSEKPKKSNANAKEPGQPKQEEPKQGQPKEEPKQHKNKKSLANMTIVFTGFRNKEWEEMLENAGGKVSSAVSKKTSLVVAANPEDNTGKTLKANDLGVPVISREQFEKDYI
jgi:NAD-dependent DNA ligase